MQRYSKLIKIKIYVSFWHIVFQNSMSITLLPIYHHSALFVKLILFIALDASDFTNKSTLTAHKLITLHSSHRKIL